VPSYDLERMQKRIAWLQQNGYEQVTSVQAYLEGIANGILPGDAISLQAICESAQIKVFIFCILNTNILVFILLFSVSLVDFRKRKVQEVYCAATLGLQKEYFPYL
jgi:hypothetical protein